MSERRLAFGQVAELYDQARPSYPLDLVNDILAYAAARPGDAAVEVGAGTGKATALFAERGLAVVALEPNHEMAVLARRNLAAYPEVVIEEAEFERWMPQRRFRLVYAAQAWHWLDPRSRFARAADALEAEGALAAFWNRVRWDASPLRAGLEEVYRRFAPELGGEFGPSPMHPTAGDPGRWRHSWLGDPEGETGFAPPEWHAYDWVQRYTSREYITLLQTHSDHIILDPGRRQALLEAIEHVIDRAGGGLDIPYVAHLGLTRKVVG